MYHLIFYHPAYAQFSSCMTKCIFSHSPSMLSIHLVCLHAHTYILTCSGWWNWANSIYPSYHVGCLTAEYMYTIRMVLNSWHNTGTSLMSSSLTPQTLWVREQMTLTTLLSPVGRMCLSICWRPVQWNDNSRTLTVLCVYTCSFIPKLLIFLF